VTTPGTAFESPAWGLLLVVLRERLRNHAKLEDRHLALRALAQTERDEGCADAGAHVDGAVGARGAGPRPIEAVHIAVPAQGADQHIVHPPHVHLAGMGVAGKHQRHALGPKPVSLLANVREPDRRQIAAHPSHGIVAARVAGERVVEAHDLERLSAESDRSALVGENLGAGPPKRVAHRRAPGPVIVVAQHRDHRSAEPSDHTFEIVEVGPTVAHEVPGDEHEVERLRVGALHRGVLNAERRDGADVQVGEVGDPEVIELLGVGDRASEAPEADATGILGK
jgi:hypothetical protein